MRYKSSLRLFLRIFSMAAVLLFSGLTADAAITIGTVGVYDEQAVQTNAVDTSATATPNDAGTFKTTIAAAFAANTGGVVNFDVSANTTDTVLNATYGAGGAKTLPITSNKTLSLQTVTSSTAISGNANGSRVALLGANTAGAGGNDFTLTFGTITGGAPGEGVGSVGLTALSRSTPGYPLSVTVTANLSNGGTQTSTFSLASALGTNDTFVGFTAPAGVFINSLSFDLPDITTGQDTRLLFDDLGFTTAVPEPATLTLTAVAALGLLTRRRR